MTKALVTGPRVTRSAVWPWMRELRRLRPHEEERAKQYQGAGAAKDGIKQAWIVAYELVPFIVDVGEVWE